MIYYFQGHFKQICLQKVLSAPPNPATGWPVQRSPQLRHLHSQNPMPYILHIPRLCYNRPTGRQYTPQRGVLQLLHQHAPRLYGPI